MTTIYGRCFPFVRILSFMQPTDVRMRYFDKRQSCVVNKCYIICSFFAEIECLIGYEPGVLFIKKFALIYLTLIFFSRISALKKRQIVY